MRVLKSISRRKALLICMGLVAIATIVLMACNSPSAIHQELQREALGRQGYIPQNDIEFLNYDDRQKLADDPTTILWCTFFPSTVGQELFTVPVIGKLTSSNKRPYPTTWSDPDSGGYYPELPGPDKMYGSSSEYRYGFDPTRSIYYDFTDLESFCTNLPTTWQKNKTTIVVDVDKSLVDIHERAREALKRGDKEGALEILRQAETR